MAPAPGMLVIPAYPYDWNPIREIVIFGELLAVSAIMMCRLFVFGDSGRPDRFRHLRPPLGRLNVPSSILACDVRVLNSDFFLNFSVVTHIVDRAFTGRH